MLQPRGVFDKIPFARRTISELKDIQLPAGIKIYPEARAAAFGHVFPEIKLSGHQYRSMLVLAGKTDLPNSAEFLPGEVDANGLRTLKKSRGAMVVFERRFDSSISDLIFAIYIDKHYCPEDTRLAPETMRLIKRAETFATEFLCAVSAYQELKEELPKNVFDNVEMATHPSIDDVFNLLCSDEEILDAVTKHRSLPNLSVVEMMQRFSADFAPSNQSYLYPAFWDYWQFERRVRAESVAKRITEIALELTKHPKFKVRRPLSKDARRFLE